MPSKPKEPSQSDKFKAAAMRAECETDEAKFESTLKKIAKGSEAQTVRHASDCAVHDAPAYSAGPCTCGATAAR